jgi:hypothetical protein
MTSYCYSIAPMASFAAQLKDKFLGVVERITGWGSGGAAVGKHTLPEEPADFHIVQVNFTSCRRI